jgi:YVTN family beta-propeller protein
MTISVITNNMASARADSIIKNIPVGMGPNNIAYNSANNNMYVTNPESNTISIIGGSSNSVISDISVSWPDGIAFNPSNNYLYVTHLSDYSSTSFVYVIDSFTNKVVDTVSVGIGPENVEYNSANNNMYVINVISNTVSVIDSSTNTVIKTISVGQSPWSIAFNPSNNYLYVTNADSDTVSIIDGSSNTVVDTLAGFSAPRGIAFNPSNNYLYVTNAGSNSVSIISTTIPLPEQLKTVSDLIKGIIQNPLDITTSMDSANHIKDILTDVNQDNDNLACNLIDELDNDQTDNILKILSC